MGSDFFSSAFSSCLYFFLRGSSIQESRPERSDVQSGTEIPNLTYKTSIRRRRRRRRRQGERRNRGEDDNEEEEKGEEEEEEEEEVGEKKGTKRE